MRELSFQEFFTRLRPTAVLEATVNLTYRCNLKCVHCFTSCSDGKEKNEISLKAWEKIIDAIADAGCLWLALTGGEPFLHKDFLPLYRYAIKKGFKVSVLTNATLLTPAIASSFQQYRPFSIEVTLYGASPRVYESITRVPGSFEKAMSAIRRLAAQRLPLLLKTVGLRQSRNEVQAIKLLSEKLLGRGKFKFDSFITPRLNGDTSPCRYRLSPRQIIGIENSDADMVRQRAGELCRTPLVYRHPDFLYWCNSGASHFALTPSGRLQFCQLSVDRSLSLARVGFRQAFARILSRARSEKFMTDSKCKACRLRHYCYFCPARAYLETGNKESSVGYYCRLARARKRQFEMLADSRTGNDAH